MDLTSSNICEIIKVCKESGVSRVVIDGGKIEVCFALKPMAEAPFHAAKPNAAEQDEIIMSQTSVDLVPQGDPAVEEQTQAVDELMISDPLKYEELMGRGELVDGRGEEKAYD